MLDSIQSLQLHIITIISIAQMRKSRLGQGNSFVLGHRHKGKICDYFIQKMGSYSKVNHTFTI